MMNLVTRRPLRDPAAAALAELVDALTARVREPELRLLARQLDPRRPQEALPKLIARMTSLSVELQEVRRRTDQLREALLQTPTAARPPILLSHLASQGLSSAQLRADQGAVARGQLDSAALLEREGGEIERIAALLEVALRVLPGLAAQTPLRDGLDLVCTLADAEPRRATRLAAVAALPRLLSLDTLAEDDRNRIALLLVKIAADQRSGPWVRRAALRAAAVLPQELASAMLSDALNAHTHPNDHLLRAQAIEVVLQRTDTEVASLVAPCTADDSELVRFTMADGLAQRLADGRPEAVGHLHTHLSQAPPRTRARAAWALGAAGAIAFPLLAGLFDDQEFVARIALDAAIAALKRGEAGTQELHAAALRAATAQTTTGRPQAVVRRAALLLSLMTTADSPAATAAAELARLRPGQRAELQLPAQVTATELAGCLVPHADTGHGFVLAPRGGLETPGVVVVATRGERFTPTLWRILHELRHPAPAKRQGHTHVVGRADLGPLRVPPARLAEATPTGVPGQRVRLDGQDGWAPEVPMVDDLLAATERGEVLLVTPLGTTRVRAPSAGRRAWTRLRIAWRYQELDQLRSVALQAQDASIAASWGQTLTRLGFTVTHSRGWGNGWRDGPTPKGPSSKGRPPASSATWLDPLTFALSMAGSSLAHLGVVLTLLGAALFGRLAWARHQLIVARAAIPLVIGGWGTRGKSGTERLKAALFEAMGIPVLSKTTGCEAMVLHAPPGGQARELFLFRPYDKATIWEQAQVATLAPALKARVLLWECMALNPRYVDMLQSWWMRDDLSTLTNAFPDHEDIQGPSGMDVAQVISGFSPAGSPLLTTEEAMLPVLAETARKRNSPLVAIPGAVQQLLPADLMSRFGHSEHPSNVALVATMAQGMGIGPVEAIGWMAERVIADVGALVIHLPVTTEGRTLIFAQGQSANDPLSFRHSWQTAGFETPCPVAEWRVTVVNNRADRVARSRMFAGLLADRASAHRHVLIGTNLQGLRSYLEQAVHARIAHTDLSSRVASARLFEHLRIVPPDELAQALAERLGINGAALDSFIQALHTRPAAPAPTLAAAQAAAASLTPAARTLAAHLPRDKAHLADQLVDHLIQAQTRHLALRAAADARPQDQAALYRSLVMASLIIIPDAGATGDQIIAAVAAAAPPGCEVRLMGLQNIKGTGLDFAYRWVEWGVLCPLIADLPAASSAQRARILGMLGTRSYGSVMATDGVLTVLGTLPPDAALTATMDHVQARRTVLLAARQRGSMRPGPIKLLQLLVERVLDPFHAILRRSHSRRVLDSLAAQRISHDRAQEQLQHIVDQQKGGWLKAKH